MCNAIAITIKWTPIQGLYFYASPSLLLDWQRSCCRRPRKTYLTPLPTLPTLPTLLKAGWKSLITHEMAWCDMKWHEMKWNDMKWNEMTWITWHEMTWITWYGPLPKLLLNDSRSYSSGTYLFIVNGPGGLLLHTCWSQSSFCPVPSWSS
jgi:hypothetical protein